MWAVRLPPFIRSHLDNLDMVHDGVSVQRSFNAADRAWDQWGVHHAADKLAWIRDNCSSVAAAGKPAGVVARPVANSAAGGHAVAAHAPAANYSAVQRNAGGGGGRGGYPPC